MVPKRNSICLMITIMLACLSLAACSVSGESARYKSQAEQSAVEGHLAEAVLTYRQALISHPKDPELLSKLRSIEEVELTEDEEISPGGCVLRFGSGQIDARIETQLDRIAEELLGQKDEKIAT